VSRWLVATLLKRNLWTSGQAGTGSARPYRNSHVHTEPPHVRRARIADRAAVLRDDVAGDRQPQAVTGALLVAAHPGRAESTEQFVGYARPVVFDSFALAMPATAVSGSIGAFR